MLNSFQHPGSLLPFRAGLRLFGRLGFRFFLLPAALRLRSFLSDYFGLDDGFRFCFFVCV